MSTNVIETLPTEEINLRFREVYKSSEWKSLDPIERAQLLLVAESAKPGTIIEGDFTHFPKILEKLGLECSLNTEEGRLYPVYMVAKKGILDEFHRGTITPPNDEKLGDYFDHLNGKFLGYPTCCTDEYCHPQHKYESNFDFELKKEIETTGTYPEELDFCPPSFTPCGVHCACASPLLKKWKNTIQQADPEAARILQTFHWQDEPYKKAHEKELKSMIEEWGNKFGRILVRR